jgi:tRNA(fMet)-specific endonuclease VapC
LQTPVDNFTIYDFDSSVAGAYADIRADLETRGEIIDSNDLFIATHAQTMGAVLVTNNTKEFKRVDILVLENWT